MPFENWLGLGLAFLTAVIIPLFGLVISRERKAATLDQQAKRRDERLDQHDREIASLKSQTEIELTAIKNRLNDGQLAISEIKRDLQHDADSRKRHEAIIRQDIAELEKAQGNGYEKIIQRLDVIDRTVSDRLVRLETKIEHIDNVPATATIPKRRRTDAQ